MANEREYNTELEIDQAKEIEIRMEMWKELIVLIKALSTLTLITIGEKQVRSPNTTYPRKP